MNAPVTEGNHWWAGKRVLVTGGSGFIGSHLIERLLAMGAVVGGLARTYGNLTRIGVSPNFTYLACDLTDAERTSVAVSGFHPEIMVHLAAHPDGQEGLKQAHLAIRNNIAGTVNALDAFQRSGGRLVVYGDSVKAYGNAEVPYREATPLNPGSSYATAKAAGWSYCQLYYTLHGLTPVAVRPTLIYGPRQTYNLFTFLVDAVLKGREEILLEGGSQTRDPLYIYDAIDAYLAVIRHGADLAGRVINIGGGSERSVEELARLVVQSMRGTQRVVAVEKKTRPTEIRRSYCDNAEVRSIVGWTPKTTLQQGLRETVDYLVAERARTSHTATGVAASA